MSGHESTIIYAAGILLLITASRFVLQELIALVRLVKQLIAEIRAPLPPVQQPVVLAETRSKNVSDQPSVIMLDKVKLNRYLYLLPLTLPRGEERK